MSGLFVNDCFFVLIIIIACTMAVFSTSVFLHDFANWL